MALERDRDFYYRPDTGGGALFIAPVDTPAPMDATDDGSPVTIDEAGVTEWKRVR